MDRLEDVLDALGMCSFEPPLTVDYRFGSFESRLGIWHCFVRRDDIERTGNYIEIRSDRVYWIALEYPGLQPFMQDLKAASIKSSKNLGRLHSVTFILAVEDLPSAERQQLRQTFDEYRNSLWAGTYNELLIWDTHELCELEKRYQTT